MHSNHTRRKFLRNMGLTAGAGITGTGWISGQDARSAQRTGLAQRSLSQVLAFASSYSNDVCLCGVSAATQATGGKLPTSVNMLASVSVSDQLIQAFQRKNGLPFQDVYTSGNTLAFHYSGRDYILENLDPADYADRVQQIQTQGTTSETKQAAYGHNYVTYQTSNKQVTDPYKVIRGKEISLKKVVGTNTPLDFEDIMTGMIESAALELNIAPAITTEWSSLLSNKEPLDPQAVVDTLLGRLHDLANLLAEHKIQEFLGSPLVNNSLRSILGMNAASIAKMFQRIKANAPRSCNPSHMWQAAFIASSPQKGADQVLQNGFIHQVHKTGRHTTWSRWRNAIKLSS